MYSSKSYETALHCGQCVRPLIGAPLSTIEFNQEVKIRIYVEASSERIITVNFNILDDKKINITGCNFIHSGHKLLKTNSGGIYLVEYVLRLPLQEGHYALRTQITSPVVRNVTAEFLDVIEDAVIFHMARWETARIWAKIHLFPQISILKIISNMKNVTPKDTD